MIVNCTGVAILEDSQTGRHFQILPDELDWDVVDGQDRSMGLEKHYQATVEHVDLGTLTWNLWEYPVGLQNQSSTEVGQARIIQDFDYRLEHSEEDDWQGMFNASEVVTKEGWAELSKDEQIERMVEWFNRMFEDPQNQTPYAIDKDSPHNYEYIWGGPYDALDELSDQFGSIVSEEVINEAAEIIQDQDGIFEWAPSSNHPDMRRHADEAMAEYARKVDHTPSLEDIRQQIRNATGIRFGSTDEIVARRDLLSIIQDLRPLVSRAMDLPAHGGMGHNQPPPELVLPQSIGISIDLSINIIQAEASSESPDAEKVVEAISALEATRQEVADFYQKTIEQVKSLGSKALAATIVSGIGALVWRAITWISAALGFPIL